ncbi:hypothetical protein [Brucella anthropi]|uniref:hypothetical protein n=1 Tax=Brucella anthropi TaxID=529 RepID=UPI00124D84DA|nr:hypothetical protein [Brucella anthropi]KAB2726428.1 hypothetical protein F9K76_06875 [Brucella anthropi]KAB2743590.1 hypothetical protein F9K74_06820 [Brucella anthropi]KAB2804337.1 hypothetical protein F9K83_06820 [Brucella anthropi]
MINRNRINGPTKAVADPSYVAECQFALEPSVFGLMKLATEAGWDSSQAATAIAILAAEIAGNEMQAKFDA